jgi:hypothetical protein
MPPGSPRYRLSGENRIFDWVAGVDPARADALYTWARAVCIDPEMATTGYVTNAARRRQMNFADVPGAQTRVTFIVATPQYLVVHIIAIDDASYLLPAD